MVQIFISGTDTHTHTHTHTLRSNAIALFNKSLISASDALTCEVLGEL
jgi:hypothetical protein